MKATARYEFDAAHRLADPSLSDEENQATYGPCARLHGHTYRLEISLRGTRLRQGMLIDFNILDSLVNEHVVQHTDHAFLNDLPYFADHPTTAEEIAQWIWITLEPLVGKHGVDLDEVTVFESPRYSATVRREEYSE
jgi:6-pyruvoyltetrahydropterin/6-carboxytetrahydropterin synthase